jgi:oligo-1,6-glucosidase
MGTVLRRRIMQKAWWKESIVYQIYPRSFADSNGDGIGDLRGMIQKLDYLKELGIDVVWLCPVYQSPNDDNGYDISDYQDIMDEFGTLADWDELLAGLHQREIKLVMDLVVNHTSDEHPWFIEARKSKDNPYRDYYIWRPGKEGGEPNNWASHFGGSAWEYDPVTEEYYLHLFTRKQPDLNWENPKVREEVYAMMTWWLERGIDGFRMDVINMISKVPGLPDAPVVSGERYQPGGKYFINGPRLVEFLGEMKEKVLSRYDILTVGETPQIGPEQALQIVHQERGALNMVFQFEHMDLDAERGGQGSRRSVKPWSLVELKQVMTRWQKELEGRGWNSIYLTNHDQPRAVSRFGNDREYRVESAKLLATFTNLLQGTPYIYQGEEIGMTNFTIDQADWKDYEAINAFSVLQSMMHVPAFVARKIVQRMTRDLSRTPMQWDEGPYAGFSTTKPWMVINPNAPEVNVKVDQGHPQSIHAYVKALIALRHEHAALRTGSLTPILQNHPHLLAYARSTAEETLVILINLAKHPTTFKYPEGEGSTLLLSNYPDRGPMMTKMVFAPYEVRILKLGQSA